MYVIAAALLIIIIAALILKMAFSGGPSATNAGPNAVTGPSVTNSPAIPPGGPSVTNAPAVTPPSGPALPNGPGKPEMPQDVRDYLEFVKQINTHREKLVTESQGANKWVDEFMGKLVDNLTNPDSDLLEPVKKHMAEELADWQALLQQFDSRPSPPASAEFAGAFREVIARQTAASLKVVAGLNSNKLGDDSESLNNLLSLLQSMKSEIGPGGAVDKSIDNANSKQTELCSRYGVDKIFEVKKENAINTSITGGL
jgi:hypothetical protein